MRTLFKSCNLSEQTHDHLNVFAADGTTTTLTFNVVGARLTEAPVPTWQTTAQTHAPCLNIVTALMFRHAFHTFKVPRFTVPRFQRPRTDVYLYSDASSHSHRLHFCLHSMTRYGSGVTPKTCAPRN